MKKLHFLRSFLTLLLAFVGISAHGDEITSTFTDRNLSTSEKQLTWTTSPAANSFEGSDLARGACYQANAVFGTSISNATITSIVVTVSSNTDGNTLSCTVGGGNFGETIELANGDRHKEYTFTGSAQGDISFQFTRKSKSFWIEKAVITYTTSGGGQFVSAPSLSQSSGTFTDPFELTISSDEGTTVKYTLDGSDPENGTVYDNKPLLISQTTTVRAIALDTDGNKSAEATATYTKIAVTGNGTLEQPYTADDVIILVNGGNIPSDKVWVKGLILGSCNTSNGNLENPAKQSVNLALGEENGNHVSVQLPSGDIRNLGNAKDNTENIGKEVCFYGNLDKYLSIPGIKSVTKLYGLRSFQIAAEEGYGTYYTDNAFEVPEGVECGIITGADGDQLTIDYKYKAGNYVPAGVALLVKGAANEYPYSIVNSSAQQPADNCLRGSVEGGTPENDPASYYYKLSYDAEGSNLGFYWGSEDGSAFESAAGKAYLVLPKATAMNVRGFAFDHQGTTGIEQAARADELTGRGDDLATRAVYTLTGQRVQADLNNLPKGIYIVNGKKTIVK